MSNFLNSTSFFPRKLPQNLLSKADRCIFNHLTIYPLLVGKNFIKVLMYIFITRLWYRNSEILIKVRDYASQSKFYCQSYF